MPTKPIRIHGVLSKITLAKDQSLNSDAGPKIENAQPVKAKPMSSQKKIN